jgi:hypothetical protein
MQRTVTPSGVPPARVGVAYAMMIGATVACFLLVRSLGGQLSAPARAAATFQQAARGSSAHALLHVLLTLAAIVFAARIWG